MAITRPSSAGRRAQTELDWTMLHDGCALAWFSQINSIMRQQVPAVDHLRLSARLLNKISCLYSSGASACLAWSCK